GVTLLCGTDAGIMFAVPGFSLHEELFYFQQAGLTPYEALKTATVNPSKASQRYADAGTIEVRKWADLVLSKSNPLDDLSTLHQPVAVWAQGRLIDEEWIQLLKDRAKSRKTGAATLLRIVESLL
ncbi:MAG: amidohydrolase family protein, partial [Imperialibacter sp.]